MYEDAAKLCVDLARKLGASYAEARFLKSRTRTITVDDSGCLPEETFETSFGVRVIVNGMWGFSAGHDLSSKKFREVTARSVKIAKLAASGSKGKIILAPTPTVNGKFSTTFQKDPFEIATSDTVDLLKTSIMILKEQTEKSTASASVYSFQEDKYIATSDGSGVFQSSLGCGPVMSATTFVGGKSIKRSYPGSLGWNLATSGYENVEASDLPTNAKVIGKELASLVVAKRCPKERTDLVIYGDLLAIHVHETVGHATESDRATDTEWDFAGSSFLTPEKLGNFEFGSKNTTIFADATIEGGTGSYDFDDELVPGKRVPLVNEGIFCGYQTSRETAGNLGFEASSGAMRASYGTRLPLIRMTNINLEPGDWAKDEIIKETKNGILATGSILAIFDQRRRTFIFGGEIGWRIVNGELSEVIKFPIYRGRSIDLWKNCDAVSKDDWSCFGVSCGKGRPHQSMRVGHYCSTARFRDVEAGDTL